MIEIKKLLNHKILILDGAMGTMIQKYNLSEEDFKGNRFAKHIKPQKGNNDLLSITKPNIIEQIHKEYLEAGADIIETNTFNSNSISMLDYGMEKNIRELNLESAKLAKKIAERYTKKTPNKPRFVAGSIGPTNKTASMSSEVQNPMFRNITFNELKSSYKEQVSALYEGGVDLFLVETIFDTLNAKAALTAIEELRKENGIEIPILISVTVADKSGRTLSGQTLKAFLASISHIDYLSVGLNCSFGAKEMKPFLKELGKLSSSYISAHPNAGLPNQLGEYDQTPEIMETLIKEYVNEKLVNIIGGCCGTTPQHIHKYEELTRNQRPRKADFKKNNNLTLSGLDALEITPNIKFVNVGERCNVSGSKKFLRLIKEGNYEDALKIALTQVENGAMVIDVNMDEALLNSNKEMVNFLNLLTSDPDIYRVPIMIDSSKWEVIENGLKCLQGKGIVNSISLKDGEKKFIEKAQLIKNYGAAMVVMAFDEMGQAVTYERKIEICKRAYEILTKNGIEPNDIIFDPNILTIATGIDEHRRYAIDFLDTISWIKKKLPNCHISGGVSNLSFAFRGYDYLREVMHSIFLYHAISRGMDFGIVNPSQSVIYDDIPKDLKILVEDVIFDRGNQAVDKLINFAKQSINEIQIDKKDENKWRNEDLDYRLKYSLTKGINDFLEEDIIEALKIYDSAFEIIDKPLMQSMNYIGELFGDGKMFLPQVVKSARTMKKAVSILKPTLELEKSNSKKNKGKLLLATVKGDVHDIGKNIVSIILACNNFEIIDLGVMTPTEEIIKKVYEEKPDAVCLSGLITPSLDEMINIAMEMQKEGFSIPLIIGGATTSKLHTALKIYPCYENGIVVHVKDASQAPGILNKLLNEKERESYNTDLKKEYETISKKYYLQNWEFVSLKTARENKFKVDWSKYTPFEPKTIGELVLKNISLNEVRKYIDWKFFFHAWKLSPKFHTISKIDFKKENELLEWRNSLFQKNDYQKVVEAESLFLDAIKILESFKNENLLNAIFSINEANSEGDSVIVNNTKIPFLRQQIKNESNIYKSLADFIMPKSFGKDWLCFFCVVVNSENLKSKIEVLERNNDDYTILLIKTILDRLAEATTEWLHHKIRTEYWGFSSDKLSEEEMFALKYQGIRPAVGYPSIPDQSINFLFNNNFIDYSKIGGSLTENGLIYPTSAVSGIILANPESHYFAVGKIDEEQVYDYSEKRNLPVETIKKFLLSNIKL